MHAREVVAAADEDAKNSAVVVRQAVEAVWGAGSSSFEELQDRVARTSATALAAGYGDKMVPVQADVSERIEQNGSV